MYSFFVVRLVNSSHLEIVTGGWVMSDEATVHYEAMLDQLIQGHQWMKTELGEDDNKLQEPWRRGRA